MRGLLLLLSLLSSSVAVSAAPQPARQEVSPEEARAQFTATRVVVTGVVEGVTEFLPVSSTGHMIVSDRLLGVDNDARTIVRGVTDRKGRPVDLDRVADDYIVIIQFGAILAVLVAFFDRLRQLATGLLRLDPKALALARSIAIAFAPAAAIGYIFKEFIPFSVEVVALALIAGGLVILFAEERLPKREASPDEVLRLSWRQALVIGLCQCCALIPGTSRSLSTILGGRWAGLSAAAATEFSFLVGLLTLSAASVYKMWSLGPALSQVYPAGPASVGLVVAAVTAFVSVKWLVGYVARHGLGVFAWYRIALGGAILATLALK